MRTRIRCRHAVSAAVVLSIGMSVAGCVADGAAEARERNPVVHPDGEWFVQTGCTACHSVSVYGVVNLAVGAPDLSLAVEDVPRRFGRPLEDFLRQPTGTMAMVLSSRIVLNEASREIAIGKLQEAYRRYQQEHGIGKPMPSH